PAGVGGQETGASTFGTATQPLTLRAIPPTGCFLYDLGRAGKADIWCADYATLFHRRLHLIRGQPRAGLCHVGNILQDHYVIRVFSTAEHSAIRNARRGATLLAPIVTCAPCAVVLDLEVDR